ncbi:MAG: hypothetical protein PWP27_2320 [Clostridiales bacterium]|nr:hypothetical protein [Clostridiales bacterium]MDK2934510.1 hypothetical protein [Clostridiales bacterium]
MNRTNYLMEIFYLSGIIGIISQFLGELETSYIILLALLILDTVTGMVVAIRHRRFSSRGLAKLLKKVIPYTVSIITVRLLEIGMLPLFETTILSEVMIAFLQITEAVSILENLTLLGVPIPSNFITILLNHLKIPGLDKVLEASRKNEQDISDIDEMIKYQIPTFECQYVRKLLEIKFQVCKSIALQIKNQLKEKDEDNHELMYYKTMAFIELGFKEMQEQWKEEKILQQYIDELHKIHYYKVNRWLQKVRAICYSQQSLEEKKEQLIDGLIIVLYQAILDARKLLCNQGGSR